MSYFDEFLVIEDCDIIRCESKSGNSYYLTFDGGGKLTCDCTGYKMRGDCRHRKEAIRDGYAQQLANAIRMNEVEREEAEKSKKSRDNFCRECGTKFDEADKFCSQCGKKRA